MTKRPGAQHRAQPTAPHGQRQAPSAPHRRRRPDLREPIREHHYTARNGQPLTAAQWLARRQQTPYRLIGHDVCGRWLLITEWVGIDPLYETALYGGQLHADGRWAWATEDAAQAGHARMLALLERYRHEPTEMLVAVLETGAAGL